MLNLMLFNNYCICLVSCVHNTAFTFYKLVHQLMEKLLVTNFNSCDFLFITTF